MVIFFAVVFGTMGGHLLHKGRYDDLKLLAWPYALVMGALVAAEVIGRALPGLRYGRPLVMARATPAPEGREAQGTVLVPLSQRLAVLFEGVLVVSLYPRTGACDVHVQAGWERAVPWVLALWLTPVAYLAWCVSGGGWVGALVAEAVMVNLLVLAVLARSGLRRGAQLQQVAQVR